MVCGARRASGNTGGSRTSVPSGAARTSTQKSAERNRSEDRSLQPRAAETGAAGAPTIGERSQAPTAAEKGGQVPTIAEKTAGMQTLPGYFNLYWDARQGKLWLEIDKWGTEFLYQDRKSVV